MRAIMVEEIKRWTAGRKSTLVLEIIHGKTTVARRAVSSTRPAPGGDRALVGGWPKRGMENALRARPEDAREQYERQLKELQETHGEAMLERRARKIWPPCWTWTRADGHDPAGT